MDTTTLGQMAVHYRLITSAQLEHCLVLQEASEPPRYLGEIIVAEGFLKQVTLDRLLTAQKRQERPNETRQFATTPIAKRLEGASIEEFLRVQIELGAIDLHLVAGSAPTARIHGRLARLHPRPLDPRRCQDLLESILDDDQVAQFKREKSLLVLHSDEALGRFRLALSQNSKGWEGVFRVLPDQLPDPATLNLPAVVKKIPRIARGLVLVTGPRGSGKTTTLATVVDEINSTLPCHVVTIDRSLEYVFKSNVSLVSQSEVGAGPGKFSAALHAALRADPDIIVLGELTSPEHIVTALTAAETGHLVLGTLHTTNAYRTIVRILDAYEGAQRVTIRGLLASTLRLVLSQQLVPGKDGDRLWLASEILTVTPAVANMIREDRLHQIPHTMQTSRAQSMQLMDDALKQLVRDGRIHANEAVARAEDPSKILRTA